jgi:rubrerythrin
MDNREFDKIMEQTIELEKEAYEFYRNAAEKVTEPAVKQLFAEFASEQSLSKEQLEELKANEVYDFDFNGAPDFKVSETVDSPRLSTDMKPLDAIALAMKKEEEAVKTYSSLATFTSDPEKQRLYHELAQIGEKRKARMEALYTNAAFPEVW